MKMVQRLAHGRATERLVLLGGTAILACDLIDPTLDARIYAASEHAIGPASWLFHLGVGAIFIAVLLLLVRLRAKRQRGRVPRSLAVAAIAIVGLVVFPTDPGWKVVSVPGRLHPIFALVAAISLLDAGSLLAHKRRLLLDWAIFWAFGFLGGFVGGAGFAERFALAVVGVLLFLGARRSR
jgi:hypothetical protein